MNKNIINTLLISLGFFLLYHAYPSPCHAEDAASGRMTQREIRGETRQAHFDAPRIVLNPASKQEYAAENRRFTGIPSIAVSPDGRIWATWYAGITPAEDQNNYVVLATSDDKGETWEEVLVIDPYHEQVRAYDPEIWLDPDGKLWVFWAQMTYTGRGFRREGTKAGVWTITTTQPDQHRPDWSEPVRLTDGVMMCKPLVLSDGTWALPASLWELTEGSAQMVVSTDRGKTWQVRGAATVPDEVRSFDEHMIIERKDGSLWMLIRTRYGIGQSISSDRGKTWSPVIPSGIQHPSARFFIQRLHSGNLLLVKHGPIDMRTGRSHLMAFISRDDGHSWSDGFLLDQRYRISYPDAQQTSDGTIYLIYDFNRREDQLILLISFTEDDVLSGSSRRMMETHLRRRIVSAGGQ